MHNEDHFHSKVAYLSHLSAIEKIKENLNETQLKIFKTYCFGHLLSMTDLKYAQIYSTN